MDGRAVGGPCPLSIKGLSEKMRKLLAAAIGVGVAPLCVGTAHAWDVVGYYDKIGPCIAHAAIGEFNDPAANYGCQVQGVTVRMWHDPKPPAPSTGSFGGGYAPPNAVSYNFSGKDAEDNCRQAALEFDLNTGADYHASCEPTNAVATQWTFTGSRDIDY